MAKSTSSSNLFSGFNPPKIKKESPEVAETIKEEPIETPKPVISDKDIEDNHRLSYYYFQNRNYRKYK